MTKNYNIFARIKQARKKIRQNREYIAYAAKALKDKRKIYTAKV